MASSKGRKILKWSAIVIVVALLGFFYGFVPYFLTGIATSSRFHFPDPNDGKTPKTYGMEFQAIEFQSSDGLKLAGWYVPASGAARGTIIYVHGQNRTRIEMLPEAQFAHGLGYNGLVFDLRHQGASEGKVSSVGYWERLDVEAAVKHALEEERAARPMVVWGISMGAAAALMAAAETPDVDAVISDSTFLNFREVIRHHYYLFRGFARRRWWWFPPLPGFPIIQEVTYWSGRRAHFDPSDFDLEKAVEKINPRPILFLAVQGDQRMPPSYAQTLDADATSSLKQIIILPGERHGEGFKSGNAQYEEAVKKFLASLTIPNQGSKVGRTK
jgi:fermentation-respiration switch protein FrsA (DUF1100 family)